MLKFEDTEHITEFEYNLLSEKEKDSYAIEFSIYKLVDEKNQKNHPLYISYHIYYNLTAEEQALYTDYYEFYKLSDEELSTNYKPIITAEEYNQLPIKEKELYSGIDYYYLCDYEEPEKEIIYKVYLNTPDYNKEPILPLCIDSMPVYDPDNPNITVLKDTLTELSELIKTDKSILGDKQIKALSETIQNTFHIKEDINCIKQAFPKIAHLNIFDLFIDYIDIFYYDDIYSYEQINNIDIYKDLEKPTENIDIQYIKRYMRITLKQDTIINTDNLNYVCLNENSLFLNKKQFYNHNAKIKSINTKAIGIIQKIKNQKTPIATTDIITYKQYPYHTTIYQLLGFTNNITPISKKGRDVYKKGDVELSLPKGASAYQFPVFYLQLEALTHATADNTEIKIPFTEYITNLGYKITPQTIYNLKEEYQDYIYILGTMALTGISKNKDFMNYTFFDLDNSGIENDYIILQLKKDYHKLLYPNKYDPTIPETIKNKNGLAIKNPNKNKTTMAIFPELPIYRKDKLAGQLMVKMALYYNMTEWDKKKKQYIYKNHKYIKYGNKKEFIGALYSIEELIKDTKLEQPYIKYKQGEKIDISTYIIQPLEKALNILITEKYITEWTYREAKGKQPQGLYIENEPGYYIEKQTAKKKLNLFISYIEKHPE